jgi:hypothetical protein
MFSAADYAHGALTGEGGTNTVCVRSSGETIFFEKIREDGEGFFF